MDLTSDHAFWTLKNGLLGNYPPLEGDLKCDVAVLGAGISGALIADALSSNGLDIVVLDKRDAGWGSTSASTAILQYEIDTPLCDLSVRYGAGQAGRAWRLCYEAVDELDSIIRSRDITCGFARRPSVYVASTPDDAGALAREAAARRSAGIAVNYWTASDLASHTGLQHAAALHSEQAAEVDPYKLTAGLLDRVVMRGGRVHDRTEVTVIEPSDTGVSIETSRGFHIRARWLAVASGYETLKVFSVRKLVSLHSTYAVVTEPVRIPEPWWRRALIWETARPYFYLRTAGDRIMMGGEDIPFHSPSARDRQLKKKGRALYKRFSEWFPHLRCEPGYTWAGTFGETEDGLAYMGPHRDYPRCLFALGFGGNGIIYSVIAARGFADYLAGRSPFRESPFRFER